MHQLVWIRVSAALALAAIAATAWKWLPVAPHELSAWLSPYRHAWYALPLVMIGFVVLGLLPVILLIAATGIAFGPVLGSVYAMAGCLASASVGFVIGRRIGLGRIERYREFIIGTLLGMSAFVVAIAGSGHQVTQALRDPSPSQWTKVALMGGVPLALAWFINRTLQRRSLAT